MAQQVNEHSGQTQPDQDTPRPSPRRPTSRLGIISFLVLLVLILLLFTGMFILTLTSPVAGNLAAVATPTPAKQVETRVPSPTATPTFFSPTPLGSPIPTPTPPLFIPGNGNISPLQLTGGRYMLYQQGDGIYVAPITTLTVGVPNTAQQIFTPNYVYDQAVRPILTPQGQLIYSGKGIWMTDIFGNSPTLLADITPDKVITSIALSDDGKELAWSTEPVNGAGKIDIYAGPLDSPTQIYEQSTDNCPCYRTYGFQPGNSMTLLLTDDRGSHEAIEYGLWSMDLNSNSPTPQQILPEDPQQGPLALSPTGQHILYSNNEGAVPIPSDNSVPTDLASLPYANSLSLAQLEGNPPTVQASKEVLPAQRHQSNQGNYRWVTTPMFSPDGHSLIYVEFSSDPQEPYDRHSAIYTVSLSGTGKNLKVGSPKLLATSSARLLELGPWLDNQNSNVITFYADGVIYALDVHSKAVSTIIQTRSYARPITVVGLNH